MVRFKQIFGLTRYFIVVYMFQTDTNTTGQGQLSVEVKNGEYFSLDQIYKNLKVEGEITKLLLLNVIEMNKRDFRRYLDGNKKNFEKK